MRHLALDFGTKRIGVALSDEAGDFAYPHSVVPNTSDVLSKIADICKAEHVRVLVMGESKNFKGEENALMPAAREFAAALADMTNLPLFWEPEFLTSAQAEQIQGKTELLDASAAALILDGYLKRKRG